MAVTNGERRADNTMTTTITIREASIKDLAAINELIDAAIMTWDVPERVKRLSLPSYHYMRHDLETLKLVVAENSEQRIVGVAAWEQADTKDTPQGQRALLLHGIYVDPKHHRLGIGSQLLHAAEQAAVNQDYSGLLVKAQTNAAGFFLAQGMQTLKVENEKRDYAHRYWKSIKKKGETK